MFHGWSRVSLRVAGVLACLSLISLASPGEAQPACTVEGFLEGLTGEWVGTCSVKSQGEPEDSKYFRITMSRKASDSFEGKFTFFRLDPKTRKPVPDGEMTIVTKIGADGTAVNSIDGGWTILFQRQRKKQKYQITETITHDGVKCLKGTGAGKTGVEGLPLGLGKNGKILSAQTSWCLDDGVMTMEQSAKARFRASCIRKSVNFTARYKAWRGTDLNAVITKKSARQLDNKV